MNLGEFKAWFEGFTENLSGAPDAKQWARIKEKIGRIVDAPPTTYPVFIHDWYSPWKRWFPQYGSIWAQSGSVGENSESGKHLCGDDLSMPISSVSASYAAKMDAARGAVSAEGEGTVFDSSAAFRDLGRAEAKSMKS